MRNRMTSVPRCTLVTSPQSCRLTRSPHVFSLSGRTANVNYESRPHNEFLQVLTSSCRWWQSQIVISLGIGLDCQFVAVSGRAYGMFDMQEAAGSRPAPVVISPC